MSGRFQITVFHFQMPCSSPEYEQRERLFVISAIRNNHFHQLYTAVANKGNNTTRNITLSIQTRAHAQKINMLEAYSSHVGLIIMFHNAQ
jgi:hypothetical protein